MRVSGVGSELNNHSSSHHVTGCLHDHGVRKDESGGMRMTSASARPDVKTPNAAETSNEMSLPDMLRNVVSTGKRLLGRIWGSDAGDGGQTVAAVEQTMAQIALEDLTERSGTAGYNAQPEAPQIADPIRDPQIATAASAVQPRQTVIQNNPYFTTTSDTGVIKENIFRKIRVKFQDMTRQLNGRFFGGKFMSSSQSSLNSRQERPKEDLRRHSRYRDEEIEIDCVLTDDSYLLDSYDRRGEYSKLTTETKV